MNSVTNGLVEVFNPTGMLLYDVVIPAVIMGVGSVLLAISGMLGVNAALWCFGIGVLIHVLLSWLAGLLIEGKEENGEHHEKSEKERG